MIRISVLSLVCGCLMSASAYAQQIDMAQVLKWDHTKVVRYHIEGVFQQWASVSHADTASQGNVTDRVTIDLDWDLKKNQFVGTPTFANAKTSVDGLRNLYPPCKPPVLKGDFDVLEMSGLVADGERIVVKGRKSYPPADVALDCPGGLSLRASPGKQEEVTEYLAIPEPALLAIGQSTQNIIISADRKTFSIKANGWIWTYTPTRLQ